MILILNKLIIQCIKCKTIHIINSDLYNNISLVNNGQYLFNIKYECNVCKNKILGNFGGYKAATGELFNHQFKINNGYFINIPKMYIYNKENEINTNSYITNKTLFDTEIIKNPKYTNIKRITKNKSKRTKNI